LIIDLSGKNLCMRYQTVNPATGETLQKFDEIGASDLELAIRQAETCFGLWRETADERRGERVASRIESGMVFVNHPTWTAADLPFGGIKTSGYGWELSAAGIHEFVNKKLVHVLPIDAPA
jgi:succinate-semialdehyde dehydrogenase / glutarate-semialdehyde dehydrogenase